MRSMLYRFFVFVGSFILALTVEVRTQAEDFTLKAETIEALEGGPVVLNATLSYHGKETVSVESDSLSWSRVHVRAPKEWKHIVVPFILGDGSGLVEVNYRTLKRGDRFSVTAFVHDGFSRIPSGRASVKVIWNVNLRGKSRSLEVATSLELDVRPATKESLAGLRKRIETTLVRPNLQATDKQQLSQWILGTRHSALLPPVLRMIVSEDDAYPLDRLLDFCYSLDNISQEVHARLLKLADTPAWRGRIPLFQVWENRRVALPHQQFQKLLESKSIWTRVLTAVTFPRQCDKAWTAALVRDLHDLSQPLPSDQFARLLRDLDNDTFAVRKSATTQLALLGERVEAQLKGVQKNSLSPEAKQRVRLILEKISVSKKSPEWKSILEEVSRRNTPAAQAILNALANGDPEAELTKTAAALRRASP